MLLAGADSIREVIAFPKTRGGFDPLTGAPTPITAQQRTEAGIDAKPKPRRRRPHAGTAGPAAPVADPITERRPCRGRRSRRHDSGHAARLSVAFEGERCVTLLVVGASGYLGGEVCRQAVAAGQQVVGTFHRTAVAAAGRRRRTGST